MDRWYPRVYFEHSRKKRGVEVEETESVHIDPVYGKKQEAEQSLNPSKKSNPTLILLAESWYENWTLRWRYKGDKSKSKQCTVCFLKIKNDSFERVS